VKAKELHNTKNKNKAKELTMNITVPGASKSTGKRKSTAYPIGKFTFKVDTATWDTSKSDEKCYNALVLKLAIIDGPDRDDGRSTVGGKFTHTLRIPTENHAKFDTWYDDAIADVVALCNAVNLPIRKDIIPLDKMAGLTFCAQMTQREYTNAEGEVGIFNDLKSISADPDAEEGTE
jgi:hypothetical protein